MRPATVGAVGITGLFLLAAIGSFATAGTADEPEVTDPAGDQVILGLIPDEALLFDRGDIIKAWFEENATTFIVNIQVTGEIGGGVAPTPSPANPATTLFDFSVYITVGGTEYIASAHATFEGVTPTGISSSATTSDANTLVIGVPKTAIGAEGGATLTSLYMEADGTAVSNPVLVSNDRGPDADFAPDFTVTAVGGGCPDPNDCDADGLPDSWEMDNFGDLDETADSDPDNDGLTNAGEHTHGTDPNDADTDDGGEQDGSEVTNGRDPLDPSDDEAGGGGGECGNPPDCDGDGLPDAWELEHFGDLDEDGDGDPDNDGLDNAGEYGAGTDPTDPDSDDDGDNDGDEVACGSDPLDASDSCGSKDPDGDGLTNDEEDDNGTDRDDDDSDNDGLNDGDEVNDHGTGPLTFDSDGDGHGDGREVTCGSDPLDSGDDCDGGDIWKSLEDNLGYLVLSGVLLLACIILSLIALLGRWA